MLTFEEKRYIKKSLIERLKLLRYMYYAMIIICLIFIGLPMAFKYLKEGNFIRVFTSILGLIYPIIIFGLFYLLIEFISGNPIFKFYKGNYTVSKEVLYGKYRETSSVHATLQGSNTHWLRKTSNCFCDTENHTHITFANEENYRNAEEGKEVIVIKFGKNINNILVFTLPK